MHIRRGNLEDLDAAKRVIQRTWKRYESVLTRDNGGHLANSLSGERLYVDLFALSTSFVCENDRGQLVGVSFLVPSGNPTEIYQDRQCYIRLVTVLENYQGMGIGRRLTERCIDFARGQGEQVIALHTAEFMDKARYIYEKLGFTAVKELPARYGKRYWLYEMNLSP